MITTERLTIRTVTAEDWKAIQAIWLDQAKSPYACYIAPKPLDDQAVFKEIEKWAGFTGNDPHRYFVICCDETVIGYVALHQRKGSVEIGYGFHSGHQGKGYARESISALLDLLKEHGISRIIAQTALKNTPSVKLLRSLGFEQIKTKKVSFYQNTDGENIVFDDGVFALQTD